MVTSSLDSLKGEAVWEEKTHPPVPSCKAENERHQHRGQSWPTGTWLPGSLPFEMITDPGTTFCPPSPTLTSLFPILPLWPVGSNPWAPTNQVSLKHQKINIRWLIHYVEGNDKCKWTERTLSHWGFEIPTQKRQGSREIREKKRGEKEGRETLSICHLLRDEKH